MIANCSNNVLITSLSPPDGVTTVLFRSVSDNIIVYSFGHYGGGPSLPTYDDRNIVRTHRDVVLIKSLLGITPLQQHTHGHTARKIVKIERRKASEVKL